jgi:SAM-dependent methyltransferase
MQEVYAQYLLAKTTVDDRALNATVLQALKEQLQQHPAPRVLELGAGVGTMLTRLLERGVFARGQYTLLDANREFLREASPWLERWGEQHGCTVVHTSDTLELSGEGLHVIARFVHGEIAPDGRVIGIEDTGYDLIIANSVLDLVDVPAALPKLFALLKPAGLFWFSTNFDGETIFLPEHTSDSAFMAVYHRSMDERVRAGVASGDSRTGRHLFQHLRAARSQILQAGSSDWVVFAGPNGYVGQEAQFLRFIVRTVHEELLRHPELARPEIEAWTEARLQQVETQELVYIAHQLDFVGRAQSCS